MSWSDDDIAPSAWSDADVTSPTRTVGQEAKRQGGLTLRGAINALASPVTLGGNVLGKAVNAVAGKEVFKPSTEVLDAYLTKAGLPEAETGVEKFTQESARTLFPAARLEQAAIAASGKPILSSAAAGGAVSGAAATPEETGREALYGALGGGIGAGLGVGLGKLGGGSLPASEEALNLMKRGITPTIGQGVDRSKLAGTVAGAIEDVASTSPFHYRSVAAQREGVNRQLREAVLADAEASGKLTRDTSLPIRQQITALREQAGASFDDLNKGLKVKESPAMTQQMLGLAQKHNLGSKDEREFSKFIADNYNSRFSHSQRLPFEVIDDIRQRAWDQMGKSTGPLQRAYYDLAEGMGKLREDTLSSWGRDLGPVKEDFKKMSVLSDVGKLRNPSRVAEDNLFSGADYNKAAVKHGMGDELGTLGHDTRVLIQSPNLPPRVNRPLTIGNAAEVAAMFGTGGATTGALYAGSKILNNEMMRRYILGDPAAVKQVTEALRAAGANVGRTSTVNIKE